VAVAAKDHYRSVVRVWVPRSNGFDGGSGVILNYENRVCLLTAEHVVEDSEDVLVDLYNGKRTSGKVLATDPVWDIALCSIELDSEALEEHGITPAEIAYGDDAMLKSGDEVEAVGYGPSDENRLLTVRGRFQKYFGPRGQRTGDWLTMSGQVRSGDSGGPIFKKGMVVGVLWGCAKGMGTVATQAGRLHRFLEANVALIVKRCFRLLLPPILRPGLRPFAPEPPPQPPQPPPQPTQPPPPAQDADDPDPPPAPVEDPEPESEGLGAWWILICPAILVVIVLIGLITFGVCHIWHTFTAGKSKPKTK
jgi:hypothetical protein